MILAKIFLVYFQRSVYEKFGLSFTISFPKQLSKHVEISGDIGMIRTTGIFVYLQCIS